MASTRCPLCDRRKAKRHCPALDRSICPVCCGTKRQVEISCPPDCAYLASSQAHPPAAVQRQQERDLRFLLPSLQGLTEGQQLVTLVVHQHLRADRPDTPALNDADVERAARSLAETYETASRGIIYEHAAGDAAAERLAKELRDAIEKQRSEGLRVEDTALAGALRRIENGAASAAAALPGGETAYLELLRRVFKAPTPDEAADGAEPRPADSTEGAGGGSDAPRVILP